MPSLGFSRDLCLVSLLPAHVVDLEAPPTLFCLPSQEDWQQVGNSYLRPQSRNEMKGGLLVYLRCRSALNQLLHSASKGCVSPAKGESRSSG